MTERTWRNGGRVVVEGREMRVERRAITEKLDEFRLINVVGAYYGPFIHTDHFGPGTAAAWAARGYINPDGILE